MGVNGYVWVRWGARDTVHTKTRQAGCIGPKRAGFGFYGRGNFPGHDVFWFLPKILKIECRWMQIGSDGCNRVYGHGQEQKQDKNRAKWASRTCFLVYAQGQKMHHVGRGGQVAKQGCLGANKC